MSKYIPGTQIEKSEFFDIKEFTDEQNLIVKKLEWKTYVNRNQKKLREKWQMWHKRKLTDEELTVIASGTDDPNQRRQSYVDQIKAEQAAISKYSKAKNKKNAKIHQKQLDNVRTKLGYFDKSGQGQRLDTLMTEYENIKKYDAAKSGFESAGGYTVPSTLGGR